MTQLPLFDRGPADPNARNRLLADDERGRIRYVRGFVPQPLASAWFDALRSGVRWQAAQRVMYERLVDVPRLTAHFPLEDAEGSPTVLLDAAQRVRAATGVPFDTVGLNLYRDGRDSVAPHNDHLHEIAAGFPIALVSLGATRLMVIRAKAEPRRVLHLALEAASLLLMSYETQLHYTHAIPKTTQPVGERISLAFRVRPNPAHDVGRRRRR